MHSVPPILKQIPVAILFGAAVLIALVVPTLEISNWPGFLASIAVLVVATALAAWFTVTPGLARFAVLIPLLDFVAGGLLRYGTGEARTIFASLVVLPVIWLASEPRRRNILYAFLGTALTLVMPFLLGSPLQGNTNELLRVLYSSTSFAGAAAVVNELSRLAQRHLNEVRRRTTAAEEELNRAAAVQRALLPKSSSIAPGYELSGLCIPTRAVGGDFYDWYRTEKGFAFTLGDVMGKGVGAGLIAATARAVVRSAHDDSDPAAALARASDCLSTDLEDTGAFATMFHARIDPGTGRVDYADAGHGLTFLVRADGTRERLVSDDVPLGLGLGEVWRPMSLQLEPGDMIVSCSDGLLDLFDDAATALDRIAALVAAQTSAAAVIQAVAALVRDAALPDDITVIAARRSEAPALVPA